MHCQAFTEEVNDAYESGLAGARTKRVVTFKTTRVDRAQTERHHSGALVVEAYSKALQDALLVSHATHQKSSLPCRGQAEAVAATHLSCLVALLGPGFLVEGLRS